MTAAIEKLITRWKPSGGTEIAIFQSFAVELTQLLTLDPPSLRPVMAKTMITVLNALLICRIRARKGAGGSTFTEKGALFWRPNEAATVPSRKTPIN